MNALVLVLNANFEPINICNTRRALGLVFTGKAAMVMNGRGYIHTVSMEFQRPSVIRLEYMIHRPRMEILLTRREIFRRDHFTCQYCGKRSANLTVDHVLPKHLGGKHTWNNVVTACSACNHHKGSRRLEEAHMSLLRLPQKPPSSAYYIYGRHLESNNEWEQFFVGW